MKCNNCNSCIKWEKKYNKLYIKLQKKRKNNINNDKIYEGLDFLFQNIEDKYVETISTEKESQIHILNNMKKNYYIYENKKIPVDSKNEYISNIYKNINNYQEDKNIIDIKIIFEWYKLYDNYISELESNESLIFEDYVKYNKKRFRYIEKTLSRFKNKVYRCFLFIKEIKNHISNYVSDGNLINILKKINVTYSKLYKLKQDYIKELVNFILEKYEIHSKKIQMINRKGINKEPEALSHDINTKKLLPNTAISYPGNKTRLFKKYGNILNLHDKDCFIDMFGGSLAASLYVRNLYKNINIVAFESNEYLMNFYEILKNNRLKLFNQITNNISQINKLLSINDKVNYIKNSIIPYMNSFDKDKLVEASWFYLLIKISFNFIKYTNDGFLRIDINKRTLDNISINRNEINKLVEFSQFLNTITLIKHDYIKNGYNIIDKYITPKTFIYIDPPYDTDSMEYTNYGNIFNKVHQEELLNYVNHLTCNNIQCIISNMDTVYIGNLYNQYNICKIDVESPRKKGRLRKEVLIYNY